MKHQIKICWMTSDNKHWESKLAAVEHQMRLGLAKMIEENGVDPSELEDWIVCNAHLLVPLMQPFYDALVEANSELTKPGF